MFKVRSECPSVGNKYYISTKNGGYNTCIRPADYGSKSFFEGSVLANCVGYASGRFNEIYAELTGNEGCKFTKLNCNAEDFIERAISAGLEISKVPTLGGILVWQKGEIKTGADGAGHVAIVEEILDGNTIHTSESDYGLTIYANRTRQNTNGNWGMRDAFKFRGCIVNPAVKDLNIDIRPVDRDEYVDQVEISSGALRVRTSPSLSGSILRYCPEGILNVLGYVPDVDGYDWVRIGDDLWCAIVENASKFLKAKADLNPVERDVNKDQLQVLVDNIRIRKAPVDGETIQTAKHGYYNICDSEVKDDFTWYKIGADAWIAGIPGKTIMYPKVDKELEMIISDLNSLTVTLEDVKKRIADYIESRQV